MSDRPNPLRVPGEPQGAFVRFRAFARAGGVQVDGEFLERPSMAAFARDQGIRADSCRALASRHSWKDRLVEWDNQCAKFFDKSLSRKRDWGSILAKATAEIESRPMNSFSGSELTQLVRVAGSELKAEREAEARRPLDIGGLDVSKLTAKEQGALRELLEKAAE